VLTAVKRKTVLTFVLLRGLALLGGVVFGATVAQNAGAQSVLVSQSTSQPGRFSNRTALCQRDRRNLLSGFGNIYNFRVLHEPRTEYPYKAWFFGWASQDCNWNIPGHTKCDAIFHARSKTMEGPWQVYCGNGKWDATMTTSLWRPVVAARSSCT